MNWKWIIAQFVSLFGLLGFMLSLNEISRVFGYSITEQITTNLTAIGITIIIFSWGTFMFTKHILSRKLHRQLEELPKVSNTKESDVLDGFLKNVKNEFFILAITADTYATNISDRVTKLINEKHITFTFLLPHPDSDWLKNSDVIITSPDTRGELITQLKRFNILHEKLESSQKNNLKIKFHHLPLIQSMAIIDPEDEGKMDISLYGYNIDSKYRTGITLNKKHNSELFQKHYISFNIVLNNTKTTDWDFKEFIS